MHSKGNHKQDKKTTLRMGGNICKWNNKQRLNLQNTQTAHGAQYQKDNPVKKWAEDLNRHFTKEDIEVCSALLVMGKCKLKSQWDITTYCDILV